MRHLIAQHGKFSVSTVSVLKVYCCVWYSCPVLRCYIHLQLYFDRATFKHSCNMMQFSNPLRHFITTFGDKRFLCRSLYNSLQQQYVLSIQWPQYKEQSPILSRRTLGNHKTIQRKICASMPNQTSGSYLTITHKPWPDGICSQNQFKLKKFHPALCLGPACFKAFSHPLQILNLMSVSQQTN